MRARFGTFGICGLFLIAGFICGLIYYHIADVRVDPSVNVGNLLQLLVTVFLGLVVYKWWREAHYRTDTAKELLIEGLKAVRERAGTIEVEAIKLCSAWDADVHAELVSSHRRLSNAVTEIETTARRVFEINPCTDLRCALLDFKVSTTSATPNNLVDRVRLDHSVARLSVAFGHIQAEILQL